MVKQIDIRWSRLMVGMQAMLAEHSPCARVHVCMSVCTVQHGIESVRHMLALSSQNGI